MKRTVGIRPRAAIGAAVVVAAALVLSGLGLTALLRNQLLANVDTTLQAQATDRARLVAEGADPSGLLDVQQREAFVVIETANGVFRSTAVSDDPACPTSAPCTLAVDMIEGQEREMHEVRLAAATATTASGSDVVVTVGAELEEVSNTIGTLWSVLALGIPLLTALVGWLTWRIIGSVIGPVEQIRTKAESISGTDLDQRVPESGTGDEIDKLSKTMNSMLDRIAADAAVRQQFASDASHELKSPLANVRTMIDTAAIGGAEWERIKTGSSVELDRMARLVDDLLFLATRDEHTTPRQHHPLFLDDLVFDEAAAMDAGASSKTIDVGAVTPTKVMGDERSLRRLIRNLLENGLRYAASTVAVHIEHTDPDNVILVVEDDGPGVPAADAERIFDRFARLESSRDRTTGNTGLGLAIVRTIVEEHGGTVTVDRSPLDGATFTVRLPQPG